MILLLSPRECPGVPASHFPHRRVWDSGTPGRRAGRDAGHQRDTHQKPPANTRPCAVVRCSTPRDTAGHLEQKGVPGGAVENLIVGHPMQIFR